MKNWDMLCNNVKVQLEQFSHKDDNVLRKAGVGKLRPREWQCIHTILIKVKPSGLLIEIPDIPCQRDLCDNFTKMHTGSY